MPTNDEGQRTIGSVDTTLRILEALRSLDGGSLGEIAAEVDLSKGALHTHLTTLQEHGFVEQRGDDYALGRRFLTFGEYVRNSVPLYNAAKDKVDEVAVETGEVAHLITEEDGLESILYESFGTQAVGREFFLKNRQETGRHLHYSAAGKAILSQFDEAAVDRIIDEHGLPAMTQHTITDREEFKRELDTVRDRGFSTHDEEDLLGVRAVGRPILSPDGDVLGALSVSAPASRLQDERFTEELPRIIEEYVNIIEVNFHTDVAGD